MYVRSDRGGETGVFCDLTPCRIRTYVGAKGANGLPPVAARQVGKTDVQFRDTFAEQTAGIRD